MSTDAPDATAPEGAADAGTTAAPDGGATETAAADAGTTPISPERHLAVQASDEFAGLRKALRGFVFPMTVAFFLWYALYVILSAYARGFMSVKLVGNINVALVFGLLQFVSTFLIAWLYSRYAERKLDPVADRIRAELESEGAAR
ncbi:Uncharacterized membrane protein, DUF485 family [Micromonospora pattaloongensis]|uniref:Uncharacterized membrane protein, DUF485 family n=1 Tax=Micromonospora pattaloongensis TaxID=405436 RepID=A0A1H3HQK9_9ACTN|nr:DUF485 domain-containing protein [Micromonospora pattaloongensis]SDY17054.1 Uncharacterized membrane protein, DUF485 family [Micromonospora pattaloongensis]